MDNPLRDRRSPSELAASGQVIEITEKLSSFERLAGIVEADLLALDPDKLPSGWRDTVVAGQLGFAFSDTHNSVPALNGRVQVTIDAVCQRCLEPFRLPLAAELRFLFVDKNSAAVEVDDYENWELADDELHPLDLVEEALIMAIPFVAMHTNDESCGKPDEVIDESGDKVQPFANLRSQMDDEN